VLLDEHGRNYVNIPAICAALSP